MKLIDFVKQVYTDCDLQKYSTTEVSRKIAQYHGQCINMIHYTSEKLIDLYGERDKLYGERYKHFTEGNFVLDKKYDKEAYIKGEENYIEISKKISTYENNLKSIENLIKFIHGVRSDIGNIIQYENKIRS